MIEQFVVLGLSLLPLLLTLTVLAFAIAVMVISVAGEPRRAWAWIAAGVVLGCGPIFRGLLILDELAVAAALFALVIHHLGTRRRIGPIEPHTSLEGWHLLLFGAFVIYMLLQAVRGTVLDGFDPFKLRWVQFFLLVGLAGTLRVDEKRNAGEQGRMVARGLTVAWAVYLLIYLTWGVSDQILTADRFGSQLRYWGTPAYTLSPLVIAFPAMILTLRDPLAGYRRASHAALFLTAVTVLFYDARVGVLVFVSFAVVSVLFVNWRVVLPLALVSVVSLWAISSLLWSDARDFDFFVSDVFESGSALFEPAEQRVAARDWDRVAHLEIGLTTYGSGPSVFLFGTGYRRSGPYVSARLGEIIRGYGVTRTVAISDDQATEAFTALIVETGVIGFGLFLGNLVITGLRVWHPQRGSMGMILLWSVTLILLWMPVINFLTAIWLFLAIAPSGLLVQLSAVPATTRARVRPVRVPVQLARSRQRSQARGSTVGPR